MSDKPIGIFDSGIGGLSVLLEVRLQLPQEGILYFADQAHLPYGERTREEIQKYAVAITRFLLDRGAKLLVVACNTASAAALHHLRSTFPETPFVGMEPAIKPAASMTKSGVVGVLATPVTFQGSLFTSTLERYAGGVRVLERTIPGLVSRIEAGQLDDAETRMMVRRAVEAALAAGADTLVLGCTHYPFLKDLIQEIAGPEIRLVDPSPAVTRQVGRVLEERGLLAPLDRRGAVSYFTTGEASELLAMASRLTGECEEIQAVRWQDEDALVLAEG